jgi:hypothetical protein
VPGPFDGSQFLLDRGHASRRTIENEQGEPVLFVLLARRAFSLLPRRLAVFYDAATKERLTELRPDPWSWRARHRLVDTNGTLLASFEIDPFGIGWICRDPQGRPQARAALQPRLTSWVAFGRGSWARLLVIEGEGEGRDEPAPSALLELRSPDFDRHDLLDLPGQNGNRFDARIALALAVLVG